METQITDDKINLKGNFVFTLRHLTEQKCIVAKLEEILPLCERMI